MASTFHSRTWAVNDFDEISNGAYGPRYRIGNPKLVIPQMCVSVVAHIMRKFFPSEREKSELSGSNIFTADTIASKLCTWLSRTTCVAQCTDVAIVHLIYENC